MKILKKSLLISTAFLWGVQNTWAMDDPEKKSPRSLSPTIKFQSKEREELLELHQKANHKDPEACFELGKYIYEEELNKTGSQDIERYQVAQRYLQTAVDKGHQEAKVYLDKASNNFHNTSIEDKDPIVVELVAVFNDPVDDEKEKERYKGWQERYGELQKLTPDVKTLPQEFDKAHATLKRNEKPLAQRGEVYGEDSSHKKAVVPSTREDIAYVGPNHMNYIQREEGEFSTYEAFAVPQKKDPLIGKGLYGRHHEPEFKEVYSLVNQKMEDDSTRNKRKLNINDEDIILDPGHGIAHAITITRNGSSSTADVRNYTPQNARYNRVVRKSLELAAKARDCTYKELAIYPEKPLVITRKKGQTELRQPIPEGFVFFLLNNTGNIEETFYFPNFDSYRDVDESDPVGLFYAKKYKISNEVAAIFWGINEISNEQARHDAQQLSERVGYKALSGRFEVLPGGSTWSTQARSALIRTAAVYRMERAAEYDTTIENMLQVAQIFNDELIFEEFSGSVYVPHLARYWVERALEEVARKKYPAEDVLFFTSDASQIPITSAEMSDLISAFEQRLTSDPKTMHIVKLLDYFDEQHDEEKYREWSDRLSLFMRSGEVPQSIVINEGTRGQLIETLENTSIVNIILDFEITESNVGEVIAGFKQRAIREMEGNQQNLVFLELPKISLEAFKRIFESFEAGIKHNDEKLFVDLEKTAVKLPSSYNRKDIQMLAHKKYSKTSESVRIFN